MQKEVTEQLGALKWEHHLAVKRLSRALMTTDLDKAAELMSETFMAIGRSDGYVHRLLELLAQSEAA